MPKAWGILEDGELWDVAYQTRRDAFRDLADTVCGHSNTDENKDKPWKCEIVPVEVSLVKSEKE